MRLLAAALLLAACAGGGTPPGGDDTADADAATGAADAMPPPTALAFGYTEHLGKLTGSALNPVAPLGMSGTDLGVGFVRDGQLAILLGDAWLDDRDSMALAPSTLPPDGLPRLDWVTAPGGGFEPFVVPGVALGGMNVPLDAVPVGDLTYYFFSTGFSFETGRHTESVLAHGTGLDLRGLVLDHRVPSDRFINVSVVVEDGVAWIFGSGPYRTSAVYLARVEVERIADRGAWTYGPDFAAGTGEAAAAPLIPVACVGELSVRREPGSGLWLMAYNCGEPRGIHLRTALAPAGPWSEPHLIYTPDQGYTHFIHARESEVGFDDGLADPGREDDWGGEYGPYLIPEWGSSPAPGVYQIVYTLSSWNPYQVHLMRTTMTAPGVSVEPPRPGEGLPPAQLVNGDFATSTTAGWTATGDAFVPFQRDDGAWRLTTFGAAGDATVGTLSQELTIDAATSELRFRLHGGDARVELWHEGEVVRRSHGRRDNDVETEVRWNLAGLRGETVRVVIVDDLAGAWGFVGAGAFELR